MIAETEPLRIALLEDDTAQAELLRSWIEGADHECQWFDTGQSFLRKMRQESFDLAILDWELPDMQGDSVLMELRETLQKRLPVLFVTNRDREEDIVHVLERGADDYLTKPVKRGEMLARAGALHRRFQQQPATNETYDFQPYQFKIRTGEVLKNDSPIELSNKEFELALFLFRNAGRLLSRSHILESVWGTPGDLNTRTVDTHVSQIRSKLGLQPDSGWRLRAIYRHGYRLERLSTDEE